ncbi:hypothetical protein, partial [Sinorhizobium sp. A49]|uniref:hypothetical protein n=1 Tax=Sinorhizobium sp. A49 TaxID=1945861 RepID=UPI001AECDC54
YRAHVGLLIWKANLSRAGFVPLDGCIMRKGRLFVVRLDEHPAGLGVSTCDDNVHRVVADKSV